jgi:hypothetical protein
MLRQDRSIVVRLVDARSGAPLRRARAAIYSADGRRATEVSFDIGPDGSLRVPLVGVPPYALVVFAWGFGLATVHGLSDDTGSALVLPLLPAGALEVEAPDIVRGVLSLLDRTGLPIAVDLSTPPGVVPFAGPRMLLTGLPAVPLVVSLQGANGKVRQTTVTPPPGGTATAKLLGGG